MATNETDEQISAEMKEMTILFSVAMGANTSVSIFQKTFLILPQLREFHIYCILVIFGFRVKISLKITYIAQIVWIGTRGSVCFVIKLLQLMSYFRYLQPAEKLSLAANIRSEFSDCQWNNDKSTIGTIGTIGKTPNLP